MARRPAGEPETDEAPEADALAPFPHPRLTRSLAGHAAAESLLAGAVAGGRMHHAWLLTGPRGIGKATLAYRLARHLLAEPDERDRSARRLAVASDTSASRQVEALSHPGLLVIRRSYDRATKRFPQTIPVEEVRRLRAFLGRTAGEGAWRAVIVDSADELNAAAANALLKSLEEPPPRTVFVLISAEPGRLLATIRSRCRRLALAPLANEELASAAEAALEAAGLTLERGRIERLATLARGSVRRLLMLSQTGGEELLETIDAVLSAGGGLDWVKASELADQLGSPAAEARLEMFFELLADRIAEEARRLAHAKDAGAPARLVTTAELWETLAREKARAGALNLDRRTLVLETLARIEAAGRAAPPAGGRR